MSHELKFVYSGATGWDAFLAMVLPERLMARRIARKLLRKGGMYHGAADGTVAIQMPKQCYLAVASKWNKLGEAVDWSVKVNNGLFIFPGGM